MSGVKGQVNPCDGLPGGNGELKNLNDRIKEIIKKLQQVSSTTIATVRLISHASQACLLK